METAKLVVIFTIFLANSSLGLFDDGCRYEYRTAADQCIKANLALEQKLDHLESQQLQNVARVNSITSAYTQEFNVLSRDTGALKTVTNRLVEDDVQIQGKLRLLQDVGIEVRNMRSRMNNENKRLADMITNVSGQLQRQTDAQMMLSIRMKTEVKENKEYLTGLQDKVSHIEERISKLGGSQQGNVDPQKMEEMEGRITELTSKLDSNVQFFQGQIGALITTIQQLQQQLRNK